MKIDSLFILSQPVPLDENYCKRADPGNLQSNLLSRILFPFISSKPTHSKHNSGHGTAWRARIRFSKLIPSEKVSGGSLPELVGLLNGTSVGPQSNP